MQEQKQGNGPAASTSGREMQALQQELESARALVKSKTTRERELAAQVERLTREVESSEALRFDDSDTAAQLHEDLTALRMEYAALESDVKAKEDMFELLQNQLHTLSDLDVDTLIPSASRRRLGSRTSSITSVLQPAETWTSTRGVAASPEPVMRGVDASNP
ncbi:hypothetical protein FOA52_001170 [Chlamydomonas sp. UWO 241]|nr:hypothetical protein FOA52_001170 [Chlamydomonas sp. UWO 241]